MPRFETRTTRQLHAGRPADLHQLQEPLPRAVLELVDSKQVGGHRRLVERLQKSRRAEVDSAAKIESARRADREQATKAALANKPIPAATVPTVEVEAQQAEAVRAALEGAVVESADALLEAAMPQLGDAAAKADEQIAAALERRAELLQAALDAGSLLAELQAQRGWIRTAAQGGQRVRPFAAGAAQPDEINRELRQAIALAEARRGKAQRERERAERAHRAEQERLERRRDGRSRGLRRRS